MWLHITSLLLATALLLNMGAPRSIAATEIEPQQHIKVEVTFAEDSRVHQASVSISPSSEKPELTAAGWANVDDFTCKLTCNVEWFLLAYSDSEDESNLRFKISFGGRHRKCEVDKDFKIVRGKRNQLKLKCGMNAVAYYEE